MLENLILQLFQRPRRDPRVILPLLKTVDYLLSQNCLQEMDHLEGEQKSNFLEDLFKCLIIEENKCRDVHRLLTIVSISICLLGSNMSEKIVHEQIYPFILMKL